MERSNVDFLIDDRDIDELMSVITGIPLKQLYTISLILGSSLFVLKTAIFRQISRCCSYVSSALDLDTLVRWSYFDDMRKHLDKLDKPLVVPFSDIIKITSVTVKNLGIIMQDSNIELECVLESNFPREILCSRILVSLENEPSKRTERYCKGRSLTEKDLKDPGTGLRKLKMQRHLDYKQDKQLSSVSVVCKLNELRRKDSCPPVHSDFRRCLESVKLVRD